MGEKLSPEGDTQERLYKTFTVESRAVDAEAGIFEAMISTESVDRDGDILLASGVRLDNYRKNPVVLFGHNYFESQAVVGKALEVEPIEGRGVRARFQFADRETSEDADRVRRLWAGGFLNATSVGFIPHDFEGRKTDDGEELERGKLFKDWELLEFSIVPVPANQDALRLAWKTIQPDESPTSENNTTSTDNTTTVTINSIPNLFRVTPPEEDPADEAPAPDPDTPPSNELTDEELDDLADAIDDALDQLEEVLTP